MPNVATIELLNATTMVFHAVTMLLLAWLIKAPLFFLAVGSQANLGGAASAPVVASAFRPALAPAVYSFNVMRSRSNRTLAWFKVGYWLAVGLILTNLLGNAINVVLGTEPRAIVGVPIAAAVLVYLIVSKKVRDFFSKSTN